MSQKRSRRRVTHDTQSSPLKSSINILGPRSASFNGRSIQNSNEIQTDLRLHVRQESVSRSLSAIRRWCFKPTESWYMGVEETEGSTGSVVVQSAKQVQVELPMDGISVGIYGLVICASFSNINVDDIEQWILDVRPGEEGVLYSLDHSSTTVVKKDELIGLSKQKSIRFRIHSAVDHLMESRNQFVTMRLDCEDRVDPCPSFEVHYIELDTNVLRSAETNSDCLLFGELNPTYIIGVGPDDQPKKPRSMEAFDISDTGDHAVTLYYSGTKAHIEVWDLKETNSNSGSSRPDIILRQPYAYATVDIPAHLASEALEQRVVVNINFTGEQVTICTVCQSDGPGIPFQVFQALPRGAVRVALQVGPPSPRELEKAETICDGKYFALASHHRSDPTNINPDDERFWVSDGRSFTVYSTKDKWSELYRIHMQPQPDILAARAAMTSIRGRYFAWTGTRGAISIWDFETGQLVSHIFIGTPSNFAKPVLSSDGSKTAVTCSNTIQIYDTCTGIKLGVFKEGPGNNKYIGVVFTEDHFIAHALEVSTVSKHKKRNMISLVRLRDMAIAKTIAIHEDYRFNYPQTGGEPVFTFRHGPNLNILKMGPILSPVKKDHCGANGTNCIYETEPLDHFFISSDCRQTLENKEGERFILRSTVNDIHGRPMRMLHITIDNSKGDGGRDEEQSKRLSIQESKTVSFPIGYWEDYTGFFIPTTSQLGVVMGGSLILWTLSASKPRMCKLALMWRFQEMYKGLGEDDVCIRDILSAKSCVHGRRIKLRLTSPSWYRNTFDVTEEITRLYGKEEQGTLTIPMSNDDTIYTIEERGNGRDFRASQERRVSQGMGDLIDVYFGGNYLCRDAIIQYLKSYIHLSDENRVSSLISLCQAWKPHLRKQIELLLRILLPPDSITWVPINCTTKENNPLAVILEIAQKRSTALGAARVIMDYCVEHAVRSPSLEFLAPISSCLHDIMKLYPGEAFQYLSRIAFVPVRHRSYLLDNSIVVRPPNFRFTFWKPSTIPHYKLNEPVFQLHVSSKEPDPNNEKFTHPVFMASFDVLWRRQSPEGKYQGSGSNGSTKGRTTWLQSLLRMIRLQTKLRIPIYVEAFNFSIEFYDNPAIAALVAYKWNTIGYWYWFVRFVFQSCFYVMVVTAAIVQVYWKRPSQLAGLFGAIIFMSIIFLWLELRQMSASTIRYRRSGYNNLDWLAFGLPLVASIHQLVIILQEDVQGNTKTLSFSVLAIFLHMLFELRIFKRVCKFVTIIQQTLAEVQVFFFIFAGGILAFATATLHLLRACPYEGCEAPGTKFPNNFLRAISSMYFFMGGRWDPVSDDFDSDNFGFHVMTGLFFFTSVVLMMNVLIALINVAFNKGDDGWRLVWIESRLRYIEAAENMSYHIPGFRETYDYFPDEIYFAATPKQLQEIRQKLDARDFVMMDLDMMDNWLKEGDDILEVNDEDVILDETREKRENNGDHNDGNVEENVELGTVVEDAQVEGLAIADYEVPDSKIEPRQEKGKNVPTTEGTPSIQQGNRDREFDSRLSRLENLLQQFSEGMATQQGQAESQFEELKRLLLHGPAR